MKISNLDLYLAEMKHVKDMLDQGVISEEDYLKAEAFLSKKHCIKDKSIYRLNNLINTPCYGINIGEEKEVKNDSNQDNRIIKKIT